MYIKYPVLYMASCSKGDTDTFSNSFITYYTTDGKIYLKATKFKVGSTWYINIDDKVINIKDTYNKRSFASEAIKVNSLGSIVNRNSGNGYSTR